MNNPLFSTLGLGTAGFLTICGLTASVNSLSSMTIAQNVLLAQHSTQALAKELQGKPVVVDIYATWCPGCKNIAPTLSSLQKIYQGKAHFVKLDVSDQNTTKASAQKAQKLGLADFFNAHKSQTSMVAIIDPSTGEVVKQFRNNSNSEDYTIVLDRAIIAMKK